MVIKLIQPDKAKSVINNISLILKNKNYVVITVITAIALEALFIYGKMIKSLLDYFLFAIISLLIGLIVSLQVYKLRTIKTCSIKEIGAGSAGTVVSIFAQMPMCCAPLTLAMLGLTGVSLFLAQYGKWLIALSMLLLVFTLYITARSFKR